MCERWVGDWTNCNILTPSSFIFCSTSFSFCWAAQLGILRAHSPLLVAGSSTASYLQLSEPVCGTGLYNCLTSTCTKFNPSTVKVIPWYLRPDALVIYTGASLTWQLGRGSTCYKDLTYCKTFYKCVADFRATRLSSEKS